MSRMSDEAELPARAGRSGGLNGLLLNMKGSDGTAGGLTRPFAAACTNRERGTAGAFVRDSRAVPDERVGQIEPRDDGARRREPDDGQEPAAVAQCDVVDILAGDVVMLHAVADRPDRALQRVGQIPPGERDPQPVAGRVERAVDQDDAGAPRMLDAQASRARPAAVGSASKRVTSGPRDVCRTMASIFPRRTRRGVVGPSELRIRMLHHRDGCLDRVVQREADHPADDRDLQAGDDRGARPLDGEDALVPVVAGARAPVSPPASGLPGGLVVAKAPHSLGVSAWVAPPSLRFRLLQVGRSPHADTTDRFLDLAAPRKGQNASRSSMRSDRVPADGPGPSSGASSRWGGRRRPGSRRGSSRRA